MKIRLLDMKGNEIEGSKGHTYAVGLDGCLGYVDKTTGSIVWCTVEGGFIVEFAFRRDDENQWIWEHSVMHQ